MKKCENCGSNHDENYGSGRFCTIKCSRGFSTKSKRLEINLVVSLKNRKPDVDIICKLCNKKFTRPFKRRHQTYCSQLCSSRSSGWKNHDKVDWSYVNKKAYADGRNYVSGGNTKWFGYKDIKVQGSYELKACQKLDSLKSDGEIKDWVYSKNRFKYKESENIERTYIIDFTITLNDDSIKFIEVKGRENEIDHIKWETVRNLGYDLEIWRKSDLF